MLIIVATGVYALLLKFLQKNSPHDVQTKGGRGVKGLLNNVKKTALFSHDGFPKETTDRKIDYFHQYLETIAAGVLATKSDCPALFWSGLGMQNHSVKIGCT